MPAIGYVNRDDTGSFKGQLKTLSIRADVANVPNASKNSDTQPDYRVLSGDVEIGAGWNRRAESSGRGRAAPRRAQPLQLKGASGRLPSAHRRSLRRAHLQPGRACSLPSRRVRAVPIRALAR